MKSNTTKAKTDLQAVLPLSLFRALKSCSVRSRSCSRDGDALRSYRSYKGRSLASRLTVYMVAADAQLVHRCAALLLLQTGGVADFSVSRNLGGVVASVVLPVGVLFVVEDL